MVRARGTVGAQYTIVASHLRRHVTIGQLATTEAGASTRPLACSAKPLECVSEHRAHRRDTLNGGIPKHLIVDCPVLVRDSVRKPLDRQT